MRKILSYTLMLVMVMGLTMNAEAQKKKKKKRKKGKVEQVAKPQPKILVTDTSKICDTYTIDNPDLGIISQNFADMNLRRQVGDYGPDEYSAYYYWQKVYKEAPGFDIRVYTDGSAIYREMAVKAKEAGDTIAFNQQAERSLELLNKGEECFPGGCFGPSKAYVYELLYPNKYDKIYSLYTACLDKDTDPYSLSSIYRYAQYMKYINRLEESEANTMLTQVRSIAMANKETKGYDFALEQMDGIDKQYEEFYVQKKAQEEKAKQTAAANQGTSLYNEMIAAVNAKNLSEAHSKFLQYMSAEKDQARKYQIAMYIGGSHYGAQDYPKAREAYQMAAQADPSNGDPYYFIGLMYLSSGSTCGPGTGFDSQRVLWPAFDKFDMALSKPNLNPEYRTDINAQKVEYSKYLPTNQQISEKGLQAGQSYTVPCWINESTTVRAN